jgi:hypothetical protein
VQQRQLGQQFQHRAFGPAHQLLKVVQHQQHTLAGQGLGQMIDLIGASTGQLQRARDGLQELHAVFAGDQGHEGDGRSKAGAAATSADQAACSRRIAPPPRPGGSCRCHPGLAG